MTGNLLYLRRDVLQ
jgi:hypothetical protein